MELNVLSAWLLTCLLAEAMRLPMVVQNAHRNAVEPLALKFLTVTVKLSICRATVFSSPSSAYVPVSSTCEFASIAFCSAQQQTSEHGNIA